MRTIYLHSLYRVGQTAGSVEEVSVFHVLRDPLEKTQRLIKNNRHRYFGKFL